MSDHQLDEERIFHLACKQQDKADRDEYLDQVCAGDQALRERVEALLQVHEQEQEFLKSNPEPAPTVDQPAPTEAVGQQIGRYKLLQQIGEGGFGVVYMAEQHRPVRRKVALKVIKPGMDTGAVVARFEAERQALAMMDHPNISRVLDGGATENGRPYFVMELVKGVAITEYCDKNQLPTRDRLDLFINVCQAVQHAHQKGIIHRDIKPSNILVTLHDGQPVVKVIDFGVAKAINQQLTEKTLFTAYGQMVGTPQYMSPEQAEMSGLDVDTRSDIYSLGVLLYELLTGETPLDAERLRTAGYAEMQKIIQEEEPQKPSTRLSSAGEQLTIIAKHRSESPERLHKLLRGDLDWIVMKALDKDRNRRYDTARGLVNDIQRHLNQEPVEAARPSTAYRIRKFVRRNKGPAVAIVLVALSLVVGICATTAALFRANQHARIAAINAAAAALEAANTKLAKDQLEATNTQLTHRNKQVSQMLLHQAFAAAMGADRGKTSHLIEMAKQAGASESQQELVRGLLERSLGDHRRAVTHFAKALELDETNLPAKCLLTIGYLNLGMFPEYVSTRNELDSWPPTTAEDYLFLAIALSWSDRVRALELARHSRDLHDSPIAQAVNAYVLQHRASDDRDLAMAQQALDELGQAQMLLGKDHAIARLYLLWALDTYTDIAREEGDEPLDKIRYADECAAKLSESEDAFAVFSAARHYTYIKNDLTLAEAAWQRAVDLEARSGGSVYRSLHSAFLLRRCGISHAIAELDQLPSGGFRFGLVMHPVLLALAPQGRARASRLWRELADTNPGGRNWLILVPLLLGDDDALQVEGEAWSQQAKDAGRPQAARTLDFCRGTLDEEEFLQGAGPEARFLAAIKSLSIGGNLGRERARLHFDTIVRLGNFSTGDLGFFHSWAMGFLAEMDRNPDWPDPPVGQD